MVSRSVPAQEQEAVQPLPHHDPSSHQTPEAHRRLAVLAVLAFVAAGAPLLADVARTLWSMRAPYRPYGDDALLQLATRDFWRGHQLLGPYSRFGWHHPGPAEFAILAVPVRLLGDGPGLVLGATLWNLAVAFAIVAVLLRRGGPALALWGGLTVALLTFGAGPAVIRAPWNPYVVLLPMLLLLLLVAMAVADGSPFELASAARPGSNGAAPAAWSVVVASFVVQTHVSTAPAALPLVGAAVVAVLWGRHRRPREERESLMSGGVIAALVVTAALWALPAYEAVTGHPSNPVRMWRFFTSGQPASTWPRAVKAAIGAMTALPFGFRPEALEAPRSFGSLAAGALWLVALGAVVGLTVWRRRSPLGLALAAAGAVAALIAIVGNQRVVGGIHDYLVVWQEAIPAALLLGLGVALFEHGRTATRGLLALGAAAVVVAGANSYHLLQQPRASDLTLKPIVSAIHDVNGELRPSDRKVLMEIDDCDAWPAAAGVSVYLEAHGRHVRVDGPDCGWGGFTTLFGQRRARRGDETAEFAWTLAGTPPPALTAGAVDLPSSYLGATVRFARLK